MNPYEEILRARMDMTQWLIHFTRGRDSVSPRNTLLSIARDGAIRPSWSERSSRRTIYGPRPCVCFTEQPLSGFAEYARLCPGVAVNIETIGGFQVEFPYLEAGFWEAFPKKPAAEFAKFLAVAKRGKAATGFDANNRDQQRGELERSIRFLRETIGLGTKS